VSCRLGLPALPAVCHSAAYVQTQRGLQLGYSLEQLKTLGRITDRRHSGQIKGQRDFFFFFQSDSSGRTGLEAETLAATQASESMTHPLHEARPMLRLTCLYSSPASLAACQALHSPKSAPAGVSDNPMNQLATRIRGGVSASSALQHS